MDTTGNNIRLALFGASHDESVGFILEGIPAGTHIDMDRLMLDIKRRSAAAHEYATPRRESDEPIVESGITNGTADGGPIRMSFKNTKHDRGEYRPIARPSHADYAAFVKSGGNEDISGGGRYSGRMTLPLVAAGNICRQALEKRGIVIISHVLSMGALRDAAFDPIMEKAPELDPFFPLADPSLKDEMLGLIAKTREAGDTLSCEAECAVLGLPVGLGEPLFDGVEGTLSKLLFMIPGLRSVEFGERHILGSEMNDQFTDGGRTLTNRSGGVNGGISNGMPIVFRCRFRPVPSVALPQTGFDLFAKKPVPLTIKGRHDTAILPRGLAAVEAAAAVGLLDLIMWGEKDG